MDAFEFASYCTGKLLNRLFELKQISSTPAGGQQETKELPTEIITGMPSKDYLTLVLYIYIKENDRFTMQWPKLTLR